MLNRAIALIRSFTVVYVVDSLLFHAFFFTDISCCVQMVYVCIFDINNYQSIYHVFGAPAI